MSIGVVLLLLFFVMLLANIPITVCLGLSTLLTMLCFGLPLTMYIDVIFAGLAKYTLLAVPFFVLSGIIMEKSGISRRIIAFAKLFIGPIPGGLAIISIAITLFWGAISGSGPATVAALGSILIPAMVQNGYNKAFAAALIAAASATAVIIPPSINLVVYGVLAGQSIGTLFIGGILPGLLIGLCFAAYTLIYALRHRCRGERYGSLREIFKAFKEAFWGLITPIIILGGIYGGIFTPTEAAVVSVVYSIVIGLFAYRSFRIRDLWRIVADAGVTSASILIIMANASAFTWLLTTQGIATQFGAAILSISENRLAILFLIDLILIAAGFFIDGISISYIFVPILLPVVVKLGMDPIWFGVVMTVAIAIGFTTPPVAVNLYPACRIAKVSLADISGQIIGFVVFGCVALALITIFPDIILWLPRTLGMIK